MTSQNVTLIHAGVRGLSYNAVTSRFRLMELGSLVNFEHLHTSAPGHFYVLVYSGS